LILCIGIGSFAKSQKELKKGDWELKQQWEDSLQVRYNSEKQEQSIITSFEKKIAIMQRFLATNPKYLREEDFSESPTGKIFFWQRWINYQFEFDIKRTESITSPYTGSISISYAEFDSKNCGNWAYIHKSFKDFKNEEIEKLRDNKDSVARYLLKKRYEYIDKLEASSLPDPSPDTTKYYTTADLAYEEEKDNCFRFNYSRHIELIFAYQHSKWTFKHVILSDGKIRSNVLFYSAGSINDPWKIFLQ
jgi:hypothetical protein